MNYESLKELHSQFKSMGLCILAFPCNQFGAQEPDTAEHVRDWAEEEFEVDFPIMEKYDVVGDDAHPLFKWIQSQDSANEIKWNFAKFLFDFDGNLIKQ